jgi:hypothetical protein
MSKVSAKGDPFLMEIVKKLQKTIVIWIAHQNCADQNCIFIVKKGAGAPFKSVIMSIIRYYFISIIFLEST